MIGLKKEETWSDEHYKPQRMWTKEGKESISSLQAKKKDDKSNDMLRLGHCIAFKL
jgi:hypothetical protein